VKANCQKMSPLLQPDYSKIGSKQESSRHGFRIGISGVHGNDPWDDQRLLDAPEKSEKELEEMALFAARLLRRTIYENQWI